MVHRKYLNERFADGLWVEKHMDYFDLLDLAKTIPDSEIDEEISKLKKEDEELDRIIKESWK